MPNPRVSVIIPCYQCDRYIAEAMESVLSQTQCTYELIVIDDGSTDRTREIVAAYCRPLCSSSTSEVFYVYQENQGVCAARNRGIELAKGEFVAFLDADDYFLPNKLMEQVAIFDANPALGLVHSGWQRVDATGKRLNDVTLWDSIPRLDLEAWLRFKPVLPSAMMFRRDLLKSIGGFDSSYKVAEDVNLVLRLSLAGCPADWLKKVTVAYRQHQNNTMNDGMAQARDVSKAINDFFDTPELPQHIKLLETNIRYCTLTWIACYLHHTGHPEKMTQYFEKSLTYSPYLPIETIINWVDSLVEFAKNNDQTLDTHQLTTSLAWKQLVTRVMANQC